MPEYRLVRCSGRHSEDRVPRCRKELLDFVCSNQESIAVIMGKGNRGVRLRKVESPFGVTVAASEIDDRRIALIKQLPETP